MNSNPQHPTAAGGCGWGKRFGLGDLWSADWKTRTRAELGEMFTFQLRNLADTTADPELLRLIDDELAWRQRVERQAIAAFFAMGAP